MAKTPRTSSSHSFGGMDLYRQANAYKAPALCLYTLFNRLKLNAIRLLNVEYRGREILLRLESIRDFF